MGISINLRPTNIFALCLGVRILSVFLVQTWFVPDEYWQSLEVAHHAVFGYGQLTWEWKKGIRSYLHPAIIAAFYKLLSLLQLDSAEALVLIPRLLQAVLSAAGDYAFYNWSSRHKWSLFIILSQWFWFYTATRTLLNTLETSLLMIALSVFPFKGGKVSHYALENNSWIWLAAISCLVRPTSAIVWAPFSLYHLFTTNQNRARLLLTTYLPIGLICIGISTAIDSYFYGELIFTPWEFVKANVIDGIGSFYGSHPWYWYVTVGFPVVLGVNILPFLLAVVETVRNRQLYHTQCVLLSVIILTLAVYSFMPHKEFRFILPLVPLASYLIQDALARWSRKASTVQLNVVAILLLLGNAGPAGYTSWWHQRGVLEVMPVLRNIADTHTTPANIQILMPCHSTPLYSHLHKNVTINSLSCEPDFTGKIDYQDEADAFFHNPSRWWQREVTQGRRRDPTHLVMFDNLATRLDTILTRYTQKYSLPYTHFPEGHVGNNVLVYERKPLTAPSAPAKEKIDN